MEEALENSKESLHSTHASAMNEIGIGNLCPSEKICRDYIRSRFFCVYQTTWCHIPEDSFVRNHCHETLQFLMFRIFLMGSFCISIQCMAYLQYKSHENRPKLEFMQEKK